MRKRISFLLVFLLFASVSNGWVAPEVIPTVFAADFDWINADRGVVKIDTLSVTKIDSTTVYGNGISKTIGEQDVTSFTVSYIVSNPDSTSVEVTLQSSPDGITWFALNTAITVTENGQIVYSTASTQRFFRIYQAKDADSTGNIRYYWIFGGR